MKLEEFLEADLKGASAECIEVRSILKNGHGKGPIGIGRLLDEPCKKCGSREVYCGHADLGTLDFYDNYWHMCLSCLDTKHKEEFSSSCSDEAAICSFCGYKW